MSKKESVVINSNGYEVVAPAKSSEVNAGAEKESVGYKVVATMADSAESVSDYLTYRGKCKEFCDELVAHDPSLRLVRGHYVCPFEGELAHWWCEKEDGTIVDPTVRQFASKGVGGEYVEFDGWLNCEECGKRMREEEAGFAGRFPICSTKCHLKLVGCDF